MRPSFGDVSDRRATASPSDLGRTDLAHGAPAIFVEALPVCSARSASRGGLQCCDISGHACTENVSLIHPSIHLDAPTTGDTT